LARGPLFIRRLYQRQPTNSRSFALAQLEFEEARTFYWTGTVNDSLDLELKPSNPEVKIQSAYVTLPKAFGGNGAIELGPSKYVLSVKSVHAKLVKLQESQMVFEGGGVSMSNTIPMAVPIGIESRYIAKGQVRAHRALYYLPYLFIATVEPDGPIHVRVTEMHFKQLQFLGRLEKENIHARIESIWEDR
jgi:hypothetical protein